MLLARQGLISMWGCGAEAHGGHTCGASCRLVRGEAVDPAAAWANKTLRGIRLAGRCAARVPGLAREQLTAQGAPRRSYSYRRCRRVCGCHAQARGREGRAAPFECTDPSKKCKPLKYIMRKKGPRRGKEYLSLFTLVVDPQGVKGLHLRSVWSPESQDWIAMRLSTW